MHDPIRTAAPLEPSGSDHSACRRRVAVIASALVLLATALWSTRPATAQQAPAAPGAATARAVFAGGCFWCVESDFDKLPGVLSTTSGYTGGKLANPSYEQVSGKGTGHFEAVQVEYDPARVSYEQLLAHFWRTIDPTDPDGQFCDKGPPYRTAIFALDAAQRAAAEASKAALDKSKPFREPIVTPVLPAAAFYPAEAYHQDYAKKNPVRYQLYRNGCGRDARLKQLWGEGAGKALAR